MLEQQLLAHCGHEFQGDEHPAQGGSGNRGVFHRRGISASGWHAGGFQKVGRRTCRKGEKMDWDAGEHRHCSHTHLGKDGEPICIEVSSVQQVLRDRL